MDILPHYIGGKRVAGTSGRVSDIYNPALGEVIRHCPLDNAEELQKTVQAAISAFPS